MKNDDYTTLLTVLVLLLGGVGVYLYTQQQDKEELPPALPPTPPPLPDDYQPEIPPVGMVPPPSSGPIFASVPPGDDYQMAGKDVAVATGEPTPQFGVRSYY